MAYSTQTAVSDGSLVLLDISIEYLERSEISVYFDGLLTTAWAWVGTTDKQITFDPAVPVDTTVLVKRSTDLSALRHEFSLGAAFTAQSLDEDLKQVLQIAQEATEGSLTGDFYADIDMHGYGIGNVSDPVLPQDVVTKAWAETGMTSQLAIASGHASAASASASASAASAAAALVSENAAELAELNAETAETNAEAALAAALVAQTAAELAETNAETAETNAAASAAAAAASYDSFDDRYLGPKAAAPALDNDGNALITGALYYDTVLPGMRVYNGVAWEIPAALAASALLSANNLSDVANAATALSNIGGQPLDPTLTAISNESLGAFSYRNKIINGGFAVNQRGYASGTPVGTGLYGHDRWKMAAGTDTYTFSTTANKTTVTIPAGKVLRQVIEGLNLQSGTYVLSWEGTAQGKIGAGSLAASGVTGSITGGTDTTIEFGPGTVANIQLEFGSVPTPFENHPYVTELVLCMRYFFISTDIRYCPETFNDSGVYRTREQYFVPMRTTPTLQVSGYVGGGTPITEYITARGFTWGANFPTSSPACSGYTVNAEL